MFYPLIPELGCNEQKAGFKNTQAARDRDGIEILDIQRTHFLVGVVEADLVQVADFTLQQKEECTLSRN